MVFFFFFLSEVQPINCLRVIYDYQITLVTTLVISYFRIEIIKMQYLRYYIHWVQVNPTAEIFFSFLVFCIWSNGRGKKLTFFPLVLNSIVPGVNKLYWTSIPYFTSMRDKMGIYPFLQKVPEKCLISKFI